MPAKIDFTEQMWNLNKYPFDTTQDVCRHVAQTRFNGKKPGEFTIGELQCMTNFYSQLKCFFHFTHQDCLCQKKHPPLRETATNGVFPFGDVLDSSEMHHVTKQILIWDNRGK